MAEHEIRDDLEQYPRVSFDEFKIPSYEEWKKEVEKALKGGDFDKKMFTKTYEGIVLEPIYTRDRNQAAIDEASFPGSGDFRRGVTASGYIENAWSISQKAEDTLPKQCNETLKTEIDKGATVYHISLDDKTMRNIDVLADGLIGQGGVSLSTLEDMSELVSGLDFETYPVYMEAGASSLLVLGMLNATLIAEGKTAAALHGTVGADPIGALVRNGILQASLEACFDEMAHTVIWAKHQTDNLHTILVNGDVYHNGGANDVQEIAYSLATAVHYIRQMQHRGIDIATIAEAIQFTFSLGANFFMEIAKLRAVRVLWAQILESFGAGEGRRQAHIHGRTSAFTKTVYDPYVNLLRNTTQAFSGVVGGIDSLEVSAFDEPIRKSDAFSRRIARNMQIMMQEEFELRQPVDPAGGSWYIETLALELADKIWKEFQCIEEKGGIDAALQEGYPQTCVGKSLQERFAALEKRSEVAVGNNMYPNMTENLLDLNAEDQEELRTIRQKQITSYQKDLDMRHEKYKLSEVLLGNVDPGAMVSVVTEGYLAGCSMSDMRDALTKTDIESITIEPITVHRWTERFEALRMCTETYKAETQDNVTVFLANMGPIPQHKPRADFTTGFMEVAAFNVLKNDGFPSVEEAAKEAAESGADVVVICSTDATYPELVPPLAKLIKETMPKVSLFLAGMPAKEMEPIYREVGVDDFIHVRANCYQVLQTLQAKKGMVK